MSDHQSAESNERGFVHRMEVVLRPYKLTVAEFGLVAAGGGIVGAIVLWFFGWLWAALRILSWVCIVAGMVLGFPVVNPELFSESLRRKWPASSLKATYFFVLMGGVGLWLFPWPSHSDRLAEGGAGSGPSRELRLDDLKLAAATVTGGWEEEDLVFNDSQSWSGTAFVIERRGGKLIMVTNSHCLDLVGIARSDADTDGTVELKKYGLEVRFASGAVKTVTRIADEATDLDLAMLEVPAEGLVEGRDYVIVRPQSVTSVQVGDRVVAVGSPLGVAFAGTHTFGSVSAIRDQSPSGSKCKVIQHDAAINHGNSGGPLFVQRRDRNAWVGVNTWGIDQAQGMFFSICAEEALNAEYRWASADPHGAAELIRTFFKIPVTVVSP